MNSTRIMTWMSIVTIGFMSFLAGYNSGSNTGFDLGKRNMQVEIETATKQLENCQKEIDKCNLN